MDEVPSSLPGSVSNLGPGLRLPGRRRSPARATPSPRAGRTAPGVRVRLGLRRRASRWTPARNTAAMAAAVGRCAACPGAGMELAIEKGLPLAGGMGGSAASAVAGARGGERAASASASRATRCSRPRWRRRRSSPAAMPTTSRRRLSGGLVLVLGARPAAIVVPRPVHAGLAPGAGHAGLRASRPPQARAVLPRAGAARRRDRAGGAPGGPAGRPGDAATPTSIRRSMDDRDRRAAPAAALPGLPGGARGRPRGGRARRRGERRGPDRDGDRARAGDEGAVAAAMQDALRDGSASRRPCHVAADRPAGRAGAVRERRARLRRLRRAPARWRDPRTRARAAGCSRCGHDGAGRAAGALRATFDRRLARRRRGGRAAASGASASCCCPGRAELVTHPEGNTRALPARRRRRATPASRDLAPQARGREPDRLVQGPRHDGGGHAGGARRARPPSPAPPPATPRPRWRPTRPSAGLPALVFVPAGKVAAGKLAQALAYGARTLLVRGDFDACLRLVREASEALGITLLNSVNPWRIEGQKTIVLEMLQQRGWDAARLDRGARRATSATRPRSARRCARRSERGLDPRACRASRPSRPRARTPSTGASAAGSGRATACRRRRWPPPSASAIRPATTARVRAIRETRGVVAAVSDAEILEAKAVVDGAGIGCEPASAASVAGVRQLRERGVIRRGDSVVADPDRARPEGRETVMRYHERRGPRANPPIEIEARVSRRRAGAAKDGAVSAGRTAPAGAALARVRLASIGSSTEKVLPMPGSDSAQMRPPCPSTMSRQM